MASLQITHRILFYGHLITRRRLTEWQGVHRRTAKTNQLTAGIGKDKRGRSFGEEMIVGRGGREHMVSIYLKSQDLS